MKCNISIVLYHPDWEQEVLPLVDELLKVKSLQRIFLLDNGERRMANGEWGKQVRYMFMGANLGYGKAHNVAIRESVAAGVDLHLVLNSDIRVKAADIDEMVDYMARYAQVGQLMPRVLNPDGTQQYLAKRLPTPLDVFGRRFLPGWMIERRNRRYELRDLDLTRPVNAPYLSGCFMLLRTQAVLEAGLFDERYFMYPEDIDLTRTIHRDWLTLYQPQWSIVHAHRKASYRNGRMLWIHIVNMCRYFHKYGWIWDAERKKMNEIGFCKVK